ncbi:hypothetical protein GT347_00105 [Xylophilus rhododendri]|jgi:vacuolar-type H+-ATPase subunit I/STV1|uniref:Uncharacterized protein n=1 Tax=Xylophilus rhododendri TaxID=2697032 RepID=A0A857J0Q7_9BURK|nr:hypothetical protein [Xylophilus rhododendri]QHI96538.1 hypothetical protein GT347_00105 [Xylophilus rhododendri]
MATPSTIARIERLIWILIYVGVLAAVLGIAVRDARAGTGIALMVLGGVMAAAGVVLIFVRARLREDA